MDYDETGGWVFSDDYHKWQNRQVMIGSRNGLMVQLGVLPFSAGLFTIKEENSLVGPDYKHAATWPEPREYHDLDGDH